MSYESFEKFNRVIGLIDTSVENFEDALKELNQARGFGILDIFGGGTIVTLIKRYKMGKAQKAIKVAQKSLSKLRFELEGETRLSGIDLGNVDLFSFTDLLFDNMIFDFAIQNKIKKAQKDVEEVINKLENFKEYLLNYRSN